MIRKAIIPVAGMGRRMAPLSAVVPKALLPLVDRRGRCLPVVHWIASEAAMAAVDELALVVSKGQEPMLRAYFEAASGIIPALPPTIRYVLQPDPAGLGDAVGRCEAFADGEPVMVLLGDHVYVAAPGAPCCAAQVAGAFAADGGSAMIGMQAVGEDELPRVGVARGEPLGQGLYRCADLVEKPSLDTARRRLQTPGLGPMKYLAHCGIYVFTPEIFDCLESLRRWKAAPGHELQLTDAQCELLRRHQRDYGLLLINGSAYDTGTPEGYARAAGQFGRS